MHLPCQYPCPLYDTNSQGTRNTKGSQKTFLPSVYHLLLLSLKKKKEKQKRMKKKQKPIFFFRVLHIICRVNHAISARVCTIFIDEIKPVLGCYQCMLKANQKSKSSAALCTPEHRYLHQQIHKKVWPNIKSINKKDSNLKSHVITTKYKSAILSKFNI